MMWLGTMETELMCFVLHQLQLEMLMTSRVSIYIAKKVAVFTELSNAIMCWTLAQKTSSIQESFEAHYSGRNKAPQLHSRISQNALPGYEQP